MLVEGFESRQDVLTYICGRTDYGGTAGKITKVAGSGNFRSSPAVWAISAAASISTQTAPAAPAAVIAAWVSRKGASVVHDVATSTDSPHPTG